eukprot:6463369-Amphidinium_carterae.5
MVWNFFSNIWLYGPNCNEALATYQKVCDISGHTYDKQLLSSVDEIAKQAFLCTRIGLIMHSVMNEGSKAKVRELIRPPLKELKTKFGKDADKQHLPALLLPKVQDILSCK